MTTATATTNFKIASSEGYIVKKFRSTPLRDATSEDLPIIDVSRLYSGNLEDRKTLAQEIGAAARKNGAFYALNHGIKGSILEAVRSTALEFFHQPENTKSKADFRNSTRYNGYKGMGVKQNVNPTEGVDRRETFYIKYDPRRDPLGDPDVSAVDSIPEHVIKYLSLEDYHWEATENLPQFNSAMTVYQAACLQLSRALAQSFALDLKVPEDTFDSLVRYPDALLALNYYTSDETGNSQASNGHGDFSGDSNTVPLGSHTDPRLITILWRDREGGLQVLTRDGDWLNAPNIPDTLLINVGDCLERASNGRYMSPVHRVRSWKGAERLSVPFFLGIGMHQTCAVLDGCLNNGEEKKYVDVLCADWIGKRAALVQYSDASGKATASKYSGKHEDDISIQPREK